MDNYNKHGSNNPNWKGGKIKRNCKICGKIFYIERYRINNKTGFVCSIKCSNKWQGRNKIKRICLICKNIFIINPGELKHRTAKFCSIKCKQLYQRKENHPLWLGGRTPRTNQSEWINLREKIYKRDKYRCRICGKTKTTCKLHVHHIIPYRVSADDKQNNLITLCASCHRKVEARYCNSKIKEVKT
jgi:hypothetical protein